MLDLATGAWIAATVLFWVVTTLRTAATVQATNILFTIGLGLTIAAVLGYGCWKFRSGSNAWRIFFTILSGCYAILTPFGFFDPNWDLAQRGFSVLMAALGIAGIVCAWLPETNRYLRDLAEYTRAVKAARYQEFLRTNPPPESVRRKMQHNQPPPPHRPSPGPPPHNHG